MKTNRIVSAFVISLLIFISASCIDGSCYEDTEAYVVAGFYRGPVKMATNNISVVGVGMEEALYTNKPVAVAKFPMAAGGIICNFQITINDTTDIITFNYKSTPYLFSKECGYSFTYDLESALSTNNIIDSIKVTKPTVSVSNEENIIIYY